MRSLPVSDYEFPEVPGIEKAYRAAHRALEEVITTAAGGGRLLFAPEAELPLTEVLSQFPAMVREAAGTQPRRSARRSPGKRPAGTATGT